MPVFELEGSELHESSDATPPVAGRNPRELRLHGETRIDDYFWLREKDDPAVFAYLEAENAYGAAVMKPTGPLQETLYREMRGHLKETDLSVPYREGGYFYYSATEEGRQYPRFCRRKGALDAPEEVTLDLNALAEGKAFIALGEYAVSRDGHLLAHSLDETGFREFTLRIKDLRTGEDLPERFERATSAAWSADGATLFYSVENDAKRSYRVYRHRLGELGKDELVYEEPDERFDVDIGLTRSGKFLLLRCASHTTSEIRFLPAGEPAGVWTLVEPREPDVEYDVDERDGLFYIRTNDEGRNFRVVTVPAADPRRENWTEIVPHREAAMVEAVDCFARFYALSEREAGLPRIRVVGLPAGRRAEIVFPEPAYEVFLTSNRDYDAQRLRYNYQSFLTPSSVFDYDVESGESVLLKRTEVPGYDPALYVSERFEAVASDGAKIPVSLVSRRDALRDGPAPTLLYGYGSYGLTVDVTFNSNRLSLLDRGVVFAVAHVRGGGELGKKWHDAGRMMRKMNTFTDFIAAAEDLIARGRTSPERLAIEGRSAGGLLVGAVLNLRPDLFHAAIATVPFVDVINTMLDAGLPLTVGEYEEWGNPNVEPEYRYLRTYSPYDNVSAKKYPAVLLNSSLHDSQVPFWEPAKLAAKLRALKTDGNVLLLRTNMAAGHGGSSGRYDRLREVAFDQAFLLSQWGIFR
ncbi:MAG: S9 family peptidase [Thermoanaerobaculia bacterium]